MILTFVIAILITGLMKIFTKYFVYAGILFTYLNIISSVLSIFTILQSFSMDIQNLPIIPNFFLNILQPLIVIIPIVFFNIFIFLIVVSGIREIGSAKIIKITKDSCE